MDFRWVKFCMVVSAYMTCLVSLSQAGEVAPVCKTPGTAIVVHVSRTSLKAHFRCGAGLSHLDPPLYSGNVYDDHGCIRPVKLSSRMPGARVECSSKIHNLHTFSVTALPTARSQLFYYRCISLDRRRTCNVIVNVPVDTAIEDDRAAGRAAESDTPTCSEQGKTIVSYMSRHSRRAFFRCSPELSDLDPPAASGAVYAKPTDSSAVPLATLAPGVLVNLSPDNALYVLALLKLPKSGFRNYYYRCVSPFSRRQACTVSIVVPPELAPASPANAAVGAAASITPVQSRTGSHGHHVSAAFATRVRTCSVHKKVISSTVSPHSLSAHFRCAAELALLDPPVLSGNVYGDKSCSHALPLRSLWGGSLHVSPGVPPSYTVRLSELPSYEPQAVFYKCRSPHTNHECLVEVKVPRTLDSQTDNQVVKASWDVPVCANAGGVMEVNVDVYARIARFKCGSSFSVLDPAVTSGNVYTTRSCKAPMSVQGHVGAGVNVSETSKNLYTVSLLGMPKGESKSLCYLCKDLSGGDVCRVVIHLPRRAFPPPRGFLADNSKMHVCHAGPEAAIRVAVQAHEGVRFKCAPGLTMQPHTPDEVFDNTDGTCSALSTLQGLVPGAQLLSPVRDAKSTVLGTNLVFLVDEAPRQRKELCYHCASSVHVNGHDCRILLTVQGSALNSDPDPRGSTLAHLPSSGRGLPVARWPTIIGVTLTLAEAAGSIYTSF